MHPIRLCQLTAPFIFLFCLLQAFLQGRGLQLHLQQIIGGTVTDGVPGQVKFLKIGEHHKDDGRKFFIAYFKQLHPVQDGHVNIT